MTKHRELILHRAERALAEEHNITLGEMLGILDQHPVQIDRDAYLRRALAQQLLLLDRLEISFGKMAFEDHDTASAMVLIKAAERRASLLGLNPSPGFAVRIQPPPANQPSTHERVAAALDALIADQRNNGEPH